jgi:hypothetical protein
MSISWGVRSEHSLDKQTLIGSEDVLGIHVFTVSRTAAKEEQDVDRKEVRDMPE